MIIYIGFNRKTGKTARNLREGLQNTMPEHEVRLIRGGKRFKKQPNVLIHWGDRASVPNRPAIEINSQCTNAGNKAYMMRTLKDNGIKTPEYVYPTDGQYETNVFVRNSNHQVEYRDYREPGDLYATEPIDKIAEYRVQVFKGEVVGVYSKIPNEDDEGIIRKNANCHFSRVSEPSEEIKEIAIKATEVLGLDFSGVDVLKDNDGELYVNEVNSAPSLNTPNVERFSNLFKEYIYSL